MLDENVVRVLLVEDSRLEARILEDRLASSENTTFQVQRAVSLEEAMAAAAARRFDVVLLDLTLSDSVGLGTLYRFREQANSGVVPVVVITGNADESMALEAVKIGAQDYLIKGEFGTDVLIRTIHHAIERQRMIVELAAAQQREHYLATHDTLTELPNRYLFHDRLAQGLAAARRSGDPLAVLFLDLDRFKTINDSLGHAVGDQLLQVAARRIARCLRASDTAARVGGDEFLVLLGRITDPRDAASVARKLSEALSRPFLLEGRELRVTPSAGIALFPRDGHTAEALVKSADTAMYAAKQAGGDGFRYFSEEMDAASRRRLALESELRRALDHDELELHFQPAVDADGRIVCVEALARWQHPDLGAVPPREFIPLAEERGLIAKLGEWVLEAACRQSRLWREAGCAPVPITVNVSSRQLWHSGLGPRVAALLEANGLEGRDLVLELPEAGLALELMRTLPLAEELRSLGVALWIDDFGTGYSSLAALRSLPVEAIKIDRSFVARSGEDADSAAVVEAMLALAASLGLACVAEGVETEAERAFLLERGCGRMQGHLFAAAMPAAEMGALLAAGAPLEPRDKPAT